MPTRSSITVDSGAIITSSWSWNPLQPFDRDHRRDRDHDRDRDHGRRYTDRYCYGYPGYYDYYGDYDDCYGDCYDDCYYDPYNRYPYGYGRDCRSYRDCDRYDCRRY
ncbi:MAG TPA: hypothetical protein VG034_08670 [Acidimicrobiia bacterium]|nr:hypothetical protein [Acidimicrobiia bacterium]